MYRRDSEEIDNVDAYSVPEQISYIINFTADIPQITAVSVNETQQIYND